ncbi:hypothetical protein QQ045_032321 [Rhodiola kirilowii]
MSTGSSAPANATTVAPSSLFDVYVHLSDDPFFEIAASIVHCTDSHVAWEDLCERFVGSFASHLFAVQQEIVELMQSDLSVAGYNGKLIQLWGDEDDLIDDESCDLGQQCKAAKFSAARKMKNRIMKFLMGLNEDYLTVRSQALKMQSSPTLAQVYNMVVRDETQRKAKRSMVTPEISTMFVSQGQSSNSKAQNNKASQQVHFVNKGKRPFCTHCQTPGHTKDNCYKIHGYPVNY